MSGETPDTVDGYRIDSLLASGGMAEIFLAENADGLSVAIKRMKPSCAVTRGYLEMFLDEASIITRFDHPNLTRAHYFEAGPPPYLVLEYIDGPDLRHLIWEAEKKQGGLPFDHGAALVSGAARGLHHAHMLHDEQGQHLRIVHRDLSPQNVMVSKQGIAKVVDFGIARAEGRTASTKAGVIKGKYAYMAPEQVVGGGIAAITDVFALGILLYETLCGVNPFKMERDDQTLFAVVRDDPVPLTDRNAKLPENLWAVARRAMQKRPEDRFPSAEAFADALDEAIATRRAPVSEAHLADYLRGLWALPVPEGEKPPAPLLDCEMDLLDLEISPTDYSMEAVQMPPHEAVQTVEQLVRESATFLDPKQQVAEIQGAATIRRPPVPESTRRRKLWIWAAGIGLALITGAVLALLTR